MRSTRGLAIVAFGALAGMGFANDVVSETAAGSWWDAAVPVRSRTVALPEPRQVTTAVGLAGLILVAVSGIAISVVSRRGEPRR